MILSFWTDRPGQTVQTQIRVYTVCNTLCVFWIHYSKVKPSCSTFRVFTTNFSGVRNFRNFLVADQPHPVIFRQKHPSILREAFLAMYRYVNVCKCKLTSREHFRQILINNFIAVSLGKTIPNTCI